MSKKRMLLAGIAVLLGALAFIAIACSDDDDNGNGNGNGNGAEETSEPDGSELGDVLSEILDRGVLKCGVNDAVPGFGFVEGTTNSGFDVQFCRAFAAAVLGDADAVEFTPLTAETRLPALQAREIDVLSRNTTWTIGRDASSGLSFATSTFYDGQGMMVKSDGPYQSMEELSAAGASARVCVLSGTTTELNLADELPESTGVGYEDNDTLQTAFIEDACDAWTSDKSQLAARKSNFPEEAGGPDSLVLFDEVFSKEPLGPVTIDNDSPWFDIVNWTVIGMILAEEKGITSENIDEFIADPGSPETARMLGVSFEGGDLFDPGLAVPADFLQEVIRQVGNYGEVYDANILDVIGITRENTQNALARDGGLLYAPPWR